MIVSSFAQRLRSAPEKTSPVINREETRTVSNNNGNRRRLRSRLDLSIQVRVGPTPNLNLRWWSSPRPGQRGDARNSLLTCQATPFARQLAVRTFCVTLSTTGNRRRLIKLLSLGKSVRLSSSPIGFNRSPLNCFSQFRRYNPDKPLEKCLLNC